ncbi:MAG: cellulase family glycosylhydrolase [Polyangiaceae bacterium]|nr:cellulase family glycosylhydrolase [Polyangiaceae bacterium]
MPELLQANGERFTAGSKPLVLRGFGLPNYLNLEHFLIGLPGTDAQIRMAVLDAYGPDRARAFWTRFQGCTFDDADAAWLASLGINALRLPFGHRGFDFEALDRVVEICRRHSLYVILDLHAAPGGQNPDWHSDNAVGEALFWQEPFYQDQAIHLWRRVAKHYCDDPTVGGYDLLNEPTTLSGSDSGVASFHRRALEAVRSEDARHLVFFEGDLYARDFSMFEPLDDPNLAYTFHYYPFIEHGNRPDSPPLSAVLDSLQRATPLRVLRDRLRAPFWCGETGAPLGHERLEQHERLVGQLLEWFEGEGISWSLWCYKDARSMGIVHPKQNAPWMQLSARACAGWDFWKEFAAADEAVTRLEESLGGRVDPGTRRELKNRLLADRQRVLVARLRDLLAKLPFDELLYAAESFRFEACERWETMVRVVRSCQAL